MKIKFLFIPILAFIYCHSMGQFHSGFSDINFSSVDSGNENEIETKKSINSEYNLFFELNVANDMTYFTDHYFSSGIMLEVYAPFMVHSPFNKILLSSGKENLNYHALTFTHNMYTPVYIDTISNRLQDHPFAAYVLLGNRKESFNPLRRLKVSSELQLGIMGPVAGGQVFQNTLHDYIPIAGPVQGWENQIGNDICFQYNTLFEKGVIDGSWFELNANAGGRLGIPHTDAQAGFYSRGGYFDDYFKHIGISKDRTLQCWLFCSGDINYVAYNAVLQGGLFTQNNLQTLKTINPVLWHTRFGGTMVYKSIKLEIAQEVISRSFETAMWHRWAYISLMVGF